MPKSKWKRGTGIELDTSAFTISDHLISKGINSLDKFTEHLKVVEKDFWENRFPEYNEWKDRWWKTYLKYGHIDLLTGFRCSGVMFYKDVICYPAQGSAFHCNLWTLNEMDKIMLKEKWNANIVNQIHDSVIFDTHPDMLEKIIKNITNIASEKLAQHWKWIIAPMSVDMEICGVDEPWSEKKKY